MEPGESWAYRARQVDDLVEVKVLRLGTQRPARVLVRFVDDAFEGREEWVPPARLKVLWDDVAEYRAREERWDRIIEAGLPLDDSREDAAETVLEILFDRHEVSIGYREAGAIHINDPGRFASRLGLDVAQLVDHPLAFVEDEELIAPWPVTELVVTTASRKNPTPVLEYIANEERKAAHEAIHGHWSGSPRRGHYFEPEICVKLENEHYRPRREIMRAWCGPDAAERFDELVELRKEIRRVGDIAQAAVDALHAAGEVSEAARLRRDLGTPVEGLQFTATED